MAIVKAPEDVIFVPTPVRSLELNSSPLAEKLYSSAPAIWTLRVLPVTVLIFKSPVLSRKMALTVPAGGEASSLVKVRASLVVSSTSPEKAPPSSVPQTSSPEALVSRALQPAPPKSVRMILSAESMVISPVPD